ncbi:DNA primase [Nocardioides baekrokdamisoli]|uniref:DNA primase n=1 Tax=Nocardioides baekrokdamisoli TaxID=1804624 RepID=A0A3G9IY20_9ACTN|nr:DNA primase [Nocardioides baekrokdamisoli]BBH16064.1 DNA primase [Nocardioides baekrokdamisoli]
MAGRILDSSIQEVREKAKIEDIVSQYVTLRNGGGGSLKGLCPFHDEKSPSFHVTPSRGYFHCFGCGEGGDVIAFVMKIDALNFGETVERLADKVGVQLKREEGGEPQGPRGPGRGKLVEANKLAWEFYAEQLNSADASVARKFLSDRDFDRTVAEQFGLGFAPTDGKSLHKHLRARGFSDEELVVAGLCRQNGWDVFQSRLLWPIREAGGDVLGFGARKLFDDDRMAGKYVNTAETPIYKKSHVLYGIDMARKPMRETGQAVIVEGYTDVMACHLSGVTTAVASCGTSFTSDHGQIVRRFIADFKGSHGEVIFTFDGDKAGQAAAMKVFNEDQSFSSQTYVVVAPDGMDPCDLRLREGETAVRDLIAARKPLYEFVLRNLVGAYDLNRADSRVDALREGARLVASVRDASKVGAFTRELASLVGVDIDEARRAVGAAARRAKPGETPAAAQGTGRESPSLRDPRYAYERETLKVLLQHPLVVGRTTHDLSGVDFTHPGYRAVWERVEELGGLSAGSADASWVPRLSDVPNPALRSLIGELAVDPMPVVGTPDEAYVLNWTARLQELTIQRQIEDVRSRLQRAEGDAVEGLFEELNQLERRRRSMRDRLVGD